MHIMVNGKEVELSQSVSIRQLIVSQEVATPEYVTVQLNEEFVSAAELDGTLLNDGDVVEFLYFMGGGQAKS
ncbi:bifunctional sulfur carrier protein/thiazole synthase protein [Peptococcaceae bacterium CEB3]|nr:bifunctional sulfur carrier protein/thiazole synthase protein [Peptococcaceae bacterium CEB3]